MSGGKLKNKILLRCLLMFVFLVAAYSVICFIEKTKEHFQVAAVNVPNFQRSGSVDYPIFISTVESYRNTRQIYERSGNLVDTYHPGSANYKYPPPFLLTVIPFIENRASLNNFYLFTRIAMLAMYVASFAMIIRCCQRVFFHSDTLIKNEKIKTKESFWCGKLFLCICTILFSWFYPYRDTLGFTTEIPILFLVVAAYCLSNSYPRAAGAAIGVAFSIKIYPVFLLVYFAFYKNSKAFVGFLASTVFIFTVSILYIGIGEHFFYFFKMLPILLSEKTADHLGNLNVEYFLFSIKMLPEIDGVFFLTTKYSVLASLLITGLLCSRNNAKDKALFYSICLTSMLLCLPNYWIPYLFLLLFPMLVLFGIAITQKSRLVQFAALVIFIIMTVDPKFLSGDVLYYYMEKNKVPYAEILEQVSTIGVNAALFHLSVIAWFCFWLGKLGELRALAPWAILFLLMYFLINKKPSVVQCKPD